MNRIISTIKSWELFSDDQIFDSIKALKMMHKRLAYNPEEEKPFVRNLIQLIGSNEIQLNIRF